MVPGPSKGPSEILAAPPLEELTLRVDVLFEY